MRPLTRATRRTGYARRTRATVLLAVLTVALGAVGGQWCALDASQRRNGEARLLVWAQLGAAQLAGLADGALHPDWPGGDAPAGEVARARDETFKRWSRALMRSAAVTATALVDARGRVIASWPPLVELGGEVGIRRGADAAYVERIVGERDVTGAMLAVAPLDHAPGGLSPAYACVFGRVASGAVWRSRAFLLYAAALAFVAATAAGVALWRLRRDVFTPIAELAGRLGLDADAATAADGDDLASLSDNIRGLYSELATAQDYAARLERSIDDVVARRTRKMSGLLRRAEHQAEIDPLTGLANRRYFDARLEPLFQEQKRRGVNLVLVMFDVDNFKTLNDSAGHAAGDALLRFVGELLRSALRECDVGVRYGGDEFAVLFMDMTAEEARAIAERVVRLFAQRFHGGDSAASVTLSAGLAALADHHVTSGAELLARADHALYDAKRSGKNAVQSA